MIKQKDIEQINVKTKDKEYPVYIGTRILSGFTLLPGVRDVLENAEKITIVCDDITGSLFYEKIFKDIKKSFPDIDIYNVAITHGEDSKNIKNYSRILDHMAANHMTGSDILMALGGGVVGDITGFAAATYLRGIAFIQIPTTILAAVDSSVGGKTAINLREGKNLAGAFWQPTAVLCDMDCFFTLDADTKADGISEIIKYGILKDEALFTSLEVEDFDKNIIDYIKKSVTIKAEIVGRDEHESGERKLLNYGHTIGHAIEKLSDFRITHGHAVAVGMATMARISDRLGISEGIYERIVFVLKRYGLPTESTYAANRVFEAALSDKKRRGSSITLVMAQQIGHCILKDTSLDDLRNYLDSGIFQGDE